MTKRKKERNIKFRNVQQNILIPQGKSYFAAHYTGSTIRSGDYNEARVSRENQSGFSPNDSLGLESMFPRIASDFFKVQIPKAPPPLPIQVHQIDRREYNLAHDTVRPSYSSGLQVAREPEYITPLPAARQMPDIPEYIEPVQPAEKPLTRKQLKELADEEILLRAREKAREEEDLPAEKPLTKTQQKKIAAAERAAAKAAKNQELLELGIPRTKTEQKAFEAQQKRDAKAKAKAEKEAAPKTKIIKVKAKAKA